MPQIKRRFSRIDLFSKMECAGWHMTNEKPDIDRKDSLRRCRFFEGYLECHNRTCNRNCRMPIYIAESESLIIIEEYLTYNTISIARQNWLALMGNGDYIVQ